MHTINGRLAARKQITELSRNYQNDGMDGTIKKLVRSSWRRKILNENAFLDVTTASGKLPQIGTIHRGEKIFAAIAFVQWHSQFIGMTTQGRIR